MEDWMTYRLGDLIEYKKGYAFKSSSYQKDGCRIVRISDTTYDSINVSSCNRISPELASSLQEYILHTGDVIVATVGSWPNNPNSVVGKVVRVPNEADSSLLNQNAVRIRSNGKIDGNFLYYLLRNNIFSKYIVNAAQGSASQASITLKDIFDYKFLAPSLNTQKHIASILRSLDDKIELNNRINHNLEEQAQALYKSWFVDFKPFKGGKFVESELGMIPEGWSIVSLNDIAILEKKSINPQKHADIFFAHYSIPAYDNSEVPEIQRGSEIMSNKFIISDHSILFSKLNPRIKRVWNVYQAKEHAICSTEFVVYKSKDQKNYPFLYSVISGDGFYDNIMSKVNGATGSHQRFHPEETLDYKLPFNASSYISYSNLLLPIIREIEDNKQENLRLISLRDSLLPKLMTGELNFNEINC